MSIRLGKTGFRFNASHSFAEDKGYDRLPHGHDYEFTVMLEGERLPGGMLYDVRQLKQMVAALVITPLDHADLNTLLPDPSLEMLAEWIWQRLRSQLPQRLRVGVQIWETRSIFAEYWG